MPRPRQFPTDPGTLVAMMIAAQVIMWTLAPALTQSAPPLDVVEGSMWGREWLLATYKHPAMPSWLLEISRMLAGATSWPSYLLSQLCVGTTFLCVYLLGCDMMGRERAAAGTLLLAGVAYYAWPTAEFNHNIMEMPFWAALPFALWRAVERRSLAWWGIFGAVAGAALYSKLSCSLVLATAALWITLDARSRRSLATPGPWLALAVFAAIFAPLAIWLVKNDFAPLRYAALRSTITDLRSIPGFALNILINTSGLFAFMGLAGLLSLRAPPTDAPAELTAPVDPRARHFLLAFLAGPLLLAIVSTVLAQKGLRSAWGSSMFHLTGLLLIAYTTARFSAEALRRIAVAAGIALITVPLGYAAVMGLSPRFTKLPLRVTWPQAEIARRMAAIWAKETNGQPLRIVAGETWAAGLIGINNKDKPSLLSNWNLAYAPWITPARLEAEGMLVVWEPPRPPLGLETYIASRRVAQARFQAPHAKRDIVINYVIVPPKGGAW
jgi:4-amino-4-deoxy-L-arabinose transferase-like glycosyltransferase